MKNQNIWLLDEFEKRKEKNPRYSLRSFANSLGVSAGVISKAFNGENSISLSTAKKILENVNIPSQVSKEILSQYEEISRKEHEIRQRVKRILTVQKEDNIKYLNGDEFLTISDWRFTFLFYLIDLLPETEDLESKYNYLQNKSGLTTSEVQERLQALRDIGLVDICYEEGHIVKNYDRFLFQGRENEASIDKIRVSFAESSKHLSNIGAMSVYPREFNGKIISKASSLAHGINLVNWNFFVLDKATAFLIEKIIENLYSDIQRVASLEILESSEIYCMSSQFFKASNSLS